MANYVMAQSFNENFIQARVWYAMSEADKDTLAANETMVFGDKVYVIATKKIYIRGNDDTWYETQGIFIR